MEEENISGTNKQIAALLFTDIVGSVALQQKLGTNPNPEKVISHIDLKSGLIKCAPFLLGITLE